MAVNAEQVGGSHYKSDYQHWDLVIKVSMGYLEGNSTKYVSRWRKKGGMEDLRKARHYLDKLLEVCADKPVLLLRSLPIKEIYTEVNRFALANNLDFLEEEYITILSTYERSQHLIDARVILVELMEEANTPSLPDEPNYPGTPVDGGHHAR